jgi:hypothetical protein
MLRWLCWAMVVLAIAGAIIGVGLQADLFVPFPEVADNVDFVERLIAFRSYDAAVYGFIFLSSVASLGVYLVAALLGVALRPFADGASLRDVMATMFVIAGIVGIVSQVMNIGVAHVASMSYCDCGYKTEEVIAQDYALNLGWTLQGWLDLVAVTLAGLAVALAGRAVAVSSLWRTLSYVIGGMLLLSVVFRLMDPYVSHEPGLFHDLFHLSDWLVPLALGILVPIWAILLARGAGRSTEMAA